MKKIFALILAFLFAACSNYQEEFDNNFGALEYADDVGESSQSGGDEPLSSETVSTQSSEKMSSSSAASSNSAKLNSSAESSSSSIAPLSSYNPPAGNYGELEYKGQKYRTATIGNQEWMAENMNAVVDGSSCYRDSSKYCDMYGRLYSWDAATKVCPEGWRLPDTTDWTILFDAVGGKAQAATRLKATTSWTKNGDGNGDDAFGFSVFAAGGANESGSLPYQGKGNSASFWTSVKGNNNIAWSVGMYWADSYPTIDENLIASRRSVRCLKDAKPLSSSSATSSSSFDYSSSGEFTDPRPDDWSTSHIYRYVRYNGLVWMDEDLNYRTDQMEMGNSSHPLYSWESAKKACPDGWRLPTIDEFNNSQGLEYEIGIWEKLVGYFLMTEGHKAGNEGMYWTQSSKDDTVYAIQFSNNRDYGTVVGIDKNILQETPTAATFAVRCVTGSLTKESPRSSSSSVFISRDFYLKGKAYATVTIGGYKWMAENLNYYENNVELIGHNMRCYNNDTHENCDDNGLYYDYESAKAIASLDYSLDNKNIGWTVPDSAEAAALLAAVENQAPYLWSVEMGGTNQSGFYTLPSGYFRDLGGGYQHQPSETCFWLWSGPFGIENNAYALCFYPNNQVTHYSIALRPKTDLYPVRLIYVPKFN